MKRNPWLLILAAVAVAMWILIPNLPGSGKKPDGAALSHKYCTSCHEYPDPSLLQRDIWVNGVLPEMGLRLGIGDKNNLLNRLPLKQFEHLLRLGIYPDTPLIPINDWHAIFAYYRDHSPVDRVPQAAHEPVNHGGGLFMPTTILSDSGRPGISTLARFVPERQEIWISRQSKDLQTFSLDGQRKLDIRMPSPIVDAIPRKETIFLGIGNMLPNEDRNGRLFTMDAQGGHPKLLIDSLHRPVQVISTDLDKDGKEDLVVAEFGFVTGQIRILNGRTDSTTVLTMQPGARNIHLRDVDKDGLPDLFVLFAQAKEQVSLFHNLGHGRFEEKVLLRFPPVYGSSYLDMADMNDDGLEDLILSNGDNADYSLSFKPFHGVRIFLNDGKGGFAEKWFYPAYGATKAIAADFDGDGDKDIAMIAFFSEPGKNGSFFYFENQGGMRFKPWDMNVPEANWLVMEADDMDRDGDIDLILGNFQFGPENEARPTRNIQALVLRNQTKR